MMQMRTLTKRVLGRDTKRKKEGRSSASLKAVTISLLLLCVMGLVGGVYAQVQPDSLIVDPAHPQWFKYSDGPIHQVLSFSAVLVIRKIFFIVGHKILTVPAMGISWR